MRDYYQHARNIYNITELLSERLSLSELSRMRKRGGLLGFLRKAKPTTSEHFDGFYSLRRTALHAEIHEHLQARSPRA